MSAVKGDSSDMSAALGLEDGPVVFSQDEADGQEEEGEQSVVTDLLTADFLTEDGGRGRNIIIAKGHSNRLGMFLLYLFSYKFPHIEDTERSTGTTKSFKKSFVFRSPVTSYLSCVTQSPRHPIIFRTN